MAKINDFQKSELQNAAKVLNGMDLFDGAKVTEVVEKIFDLTENLNDYATVSIAQIFHHLVRNHPIISIDESDEWTFLYSWRDDESDIVLDNGEPSDGLGACYRCDRYPNLIKYVRLDGTTYYIDEKYYRCPDGMKDDYDSKTVKLPYLPPYEKPMLTSRASSMRDVYDTLDPVQRDMVNYLIRKAVQDNGRD